MTPPADGKLDGRSLPPRLGRTLRRVPLLAIGFLAMAWGVWLGLLRVGWSLPLPWPEQLIAHGPLMVCGFLGTVIGLERAVGLGRPWAYSAPLLTAAGALLVVFGPPGRAGALFITLGSLVVVAIFGVVLRRQPSMFVFTMALGAVAWLVGNLQWLAGSTIYRFVYWWVAFLVLTIAGERLELNRLLRPTRAVRLTFGVALAAVAGGLLMMPRWPDAGVRTLAVGLLVMTWWLARYDLARRTVRQRGVTRFMAVCLLAGYAWLGIGAALAAVNGVVISGPPYDATLHAVFLGFVMSMVFAHAPIILPAVLGIRLDYRPAFYLHVAVLHASLAVRLVGDLVDELGRWRAWGALLNALALLLFLANTARSVRIAAPAPATASAAHR